MAKNLSLIAICIGSRFLGIFIKINISVVKRRLEVLKGAASRLLLILVLSAEGLMSFVGISHFALRVMNNSTTLDWNRFASLVKVDYEFLGR